MSDPSNLYSDLTLDLDWYSKDPDGRNWPGPEGKCVCSNCGNRDEHQEGYTCLQQVCSECGTRMTRQASKTIKTSKGMEALHKEIAKVLFRISNNELEDYYGISKDPLFVEASMLEVANWMAYGWELNHPFWYENDKSLSQMPMMDDSEHDIAIMHCGLVTLKGAPQYAKGAFFCVGNKLKTLDEGPEKVDGAFDCSNNLLLRSLKGAPSRVGEDFLCVHNRKLVSLKGAPEYVGGDFDCMDCPNVSPRELRWLENNITIRGDLLHDEHIEL